MEVAGGSAGSTIQVGLKGRSVRRPFGARSLGAATQSSACRLHLGLDSCRRFSAAVGGDFTGRGVISKAPEKGFSPPQSHHKSNRVSWLEGWVGRRWESKFYNTCKMGVFWKTVTLTMCRIR